MTPNHKDHHDGKGPVLLKMDHEEYSKEAEEMGLLNTTKRL